MSTAVSIVNDALFHLGQHEIQSLTEETVEASQANRVYDTCRRKALSGGTWRFASKVASLAEIASPTVYGYSYAYTKPSDCLRPLVLMPDTDPPRTYEVVGTEIWTDESPAVLRYTYDITDPSLFDPLFCDALSWLLAAYLAMPLTGDVAKQQAASQQYLIAMATAKAVSASGARKGDKLGKSIKDSRL
jgi:hypothetical protein